MTTRRYLPVRRLRNEALPLGIAFAVPLALAALFPCGGWMRGVCLPVADRAEAPHAAPGEACCAFVTLTPEQEARARASARTAWQRDRVASRQMRIDMYADALPPMPREPVLGFSSAHTAPTAAPYAAPIHLPALAAPPPSHLAPPPGDQTPTPTFSRDELLTLPSTNYQLPTANSPLPTTNCQLPTANYQLPTANYQLPTANYQLTTTYTP